MSQHKRNSKNSFIFLAFLYPDCVDDSLHDIDNVDSDSEILSQITIFLALPLTQCFLG